MATRSALSMFSVKILSVWRKSRFIRRAMIIGFLIFIAYAETFRALQGLFTCTTASIGREISPGGAWIAQLDETVCDAGPMSHVNTDVMLCPAGNGVCIDLMGVDTVYHEDRPRLSWLAVDHLSIALKNREYLKVLQLDPPGVRVTITVD